MTQTADRTAEQVLRNRVRAAQLRVTQRTDELADAAGPDDLDERRSIVAVAEQALTLAQRELAAQQGQNVEPVAWASATRFELKRYALVLMQDDPQLTPDEAQAQALHDDTIRRADWMARHAPQLLADVAALAQPED